MDYSLADWIKLYVFPGGRREFAQRQTATRAEAASWAELASHCRAAVEHEQRVRNMRRELISNQQQRTNPRLVELDPQIDRTIGAIYRRLQDAVVTFAETDLGHQAAAIMNRLFPLGAGDVTSRPYVEQSAEVKSILEVFDGELRLAVEEQGLTRFVDHLRALNSEFQTLLAQERPEGVTADHVRAADAQGQKQLLQTVALILGRYPGNDPDQVSQRGALLSPIAHQQDAIRAYLRSRRAVRDVEPETGNEQPVEPAGPAEPTPQIV